LTAPAAAGREWCDWPDELIRFAEESEVIPASRERDLRSALNRARTLVGNGLADVRAELKTILRQLDRISPAVAGMSRQSYANLKSRVRCAFRLAMAHLAPARSHAKLTGDLAIYEALLPLRERRERSRWLRFIQAIGWSILDVGEEQMQRFESYPEYEAMLAGHAKTARADRAGERRINLAEAAVVRRIFELFAAGTSPRALARR
jgi:hypothetical protein